MGDGELVDLIARMALFVQEVQKEEDSADRELEAGNARAEGSRLESELQRCRSELGTMKGQLVAADEAVRELRSEVAKLTKTSGGL
jgi:chromosome segregation ATPase